MEKYNTHFDCFDFFFYCKKNSLLCVGKNVENVVILYTCYFFKAKDPLI